MTIDNSAKCRFLINLFELYMLKRIANYRNLVSRQQKTILSYKTGR